MEKTKILLVDDEEDAVKTLQVRLQNAGYEVLTAQNGAQALDLLRQQHVDLILADFMMPEVNGLELARLVKANPNWYETQIMLFSCNTDPEFRRRAIELGAVEYMPKTEGYQNIIRRVGELTGPREGRIVTLPEFSRQETAYREQLRALARSLVDVLHLAEMNASMPDSAKYAVHSAKRIAEDIQRLSGSEKENAGSGDLTKNMERNSTETGKAV